MILHTVSPLEKVLEGYEKGGAEQIEMHYQGKTLIVEPVDYYTGKLVRIISANPHDYLHPQLQPGSLIYFNSSIVLSSPF